MVRIDSQNDLLCRIDDSYFRVKGWLIEGASNRIFEVGDKFILSDLKEMCRRFGLEWYFVSFRNGITISCNRACRKISFVGDSMRKTSYITCKCSWCVRFKDVERNTCSNNDSVVITAVCVVHSNTCHPSYVYQFVLARTCSSNYNKCADQCLKEVMVQMNLEPFVSIRARREFISKVVSERKYIDKNMINNIRIRAQTKKLELEDADIETDPEHVDTSFITSYRDTLIIILKVNFLLSYCLIYFHNCCNGIMILNIWYRSYEYD